MGGEDDNMTARANKLVDNTEENLPLCHLPKTNVVHLLVGSERSLSKESDTSGTRNRPKDVNTHTLNTKDEWRTINRKGKSVAPKLNGPSHVHPPRHRSAIQPINDRAQLWIDKGHRSASQPRKNNNTLNRETAGPVSSTPASQVTRTTFDER